MDIKMPKMNGVETLKKIKIIRPDALVVMMTAYAVSDLVQDAIQEGARAVLYKPFDMDDVLKQIEDLVSPGNWLGPERPSRT
jgi:DNA-binding NarL/FixJ family response regulator